MQSNNNDRNRDMDRERQNENENRGNLGNRENERYNLSGRNPENLPRYARRSSHRLPGRL